MTIEKSSRGQEALVERRRDRVGLATRRLTALFCLALPALGCMDPLREEATDALGEETPGVVEGPLHRAGQPCLLCHNGTEATEFAVAGTVYKLADSKAPVPGAVVSMIDKNGVTHVAATNCVGSFFVRPGDYAPVYPMWVKIELGSWLQEMESPVNGEGSCAACHGESPGPSSAGHVYLLPFDDGVKKDECQ